MTIGNLTCMFREGMGVECLLEEKASIEKRLKELGYDGDCAYEKAMVAFYKRRLDQCVEMIEEYDHQMQA